MGTLLAGFAIKLTPFALGIASLFGLSTPAMTPNRAVLYHFTPAFLPAQQLPTDGLLHVPFLSSPTTSKPIGGRATTTVSATSPATTSLQGPLKVKPMPVLPKKTPYLVPSSRATSTPLPPILPSRPSASVATSAASGPGATSTVFQTQPTTTAVTPSFDVNASVRQSLVNILCITKVAGSLHPISGSGVMIDSRGVVLTNAHIGQYFLLKDFLTPNFIDCTLRTGSPAKIAYKATLLYISAPWIERHYPDIVVADPTGTGENDFALLLVTGSATAAPLPASFPSLPLELSDAAVNQGQMVTSAGYAAGFLGGLTIEQDLFASSAVSSVREVFTFDSGSPDLFSIGGTIVAQKGSSGGAVADADGNLVGVIVTATEAPTTAERDLRAITLSHIDRSLTKSTGSGIRALLSGNLVPKAAFFESTLAPHLRDLLTSQILSQ
jgi:hypothetical protein